ncbi:MAG: HAMP domain-containing sensor histidine kinase [Planctomycetota bacterium]|nr:HAMP domain-containing sensor histidine kinase [Planctomycetota bacterium]
MHRPWQIGLVFIACLAVVLAALGWTSHQVLRLDRQAIQEETVRLALWRMESALVSLVAQEATRPYFEYTAFYSPDRSYARMYNREVGKGELFVPSPILVETSPYIRLHFQFGPDGALTSPQAPAETPGKGAPLLAYATRDQIETAAALLVQLKPLVDLKKLAAELPGPADRPLPAPALTMGANWNNDAQNSAFQQEDQVNQPAQQQGTIAQRQNQRNIKEYQARAQTYQQMAANTLTNPFTNIDNNAGINRFVALADVREGVMKAVWLGGELVLARRVSVGGREYIQGAWLDWPAIRQWLLESVKDLVPQADLAPVRPDTAADRSGWRSSDISSLMGREGYMEEPGRLLATLPVRLVPGAVAPETEEGLSPLGLSLIVAWACVVLAGVAVAVLLWGTVALSERRAAFVSAVTHELRTPLTTFRMYSEMLAGGMVTDDTKRLRYLDTLRRESERLVHLVENVLSYARLERGRARGRTETVGLADLVGRIGPRLAERAGQAGFELVTENGADATVRADPSAVEQILFNLVDNACKYAAGAADKRIHLVAEAAGGRAVLKVCDHGPGISARDARRLFRPFSKSARDAANSAPGVGLGLALSRRLARDMGGDLTLIPRPGDGACFALFLPQG